MTRAAVTGTGGAVHSGAGSGRDRGVAGRKLAVVTESPSTPTVPGPRHALHDGVLRPTDEQEEIVDALRSDRNIVVQARAGTGKTATLVMATRTQPYRRTLYLAYNKAIAVDARRKFGGNVECRTLHSLAFARAKRWMRDRLGMSRQNGRMVAAILGITRPLIIPKDSFDMPIDARLSAHHLGRLTVDGIRRFCYSADQEIDHTHAPKQPGLTPGAQEHLAHELVPLMRRGWDDITSPLGKLRLEHDHYLKLWAMTEPQLPFDLILLDEAQDSNRLTSHLIASQRHAQTAAIGDSAQQLYGWRGGYDALDHFTNHDLLHLTQSFRFGPAIANVGNVFLRLQEARPLVRGDHRIESRLVRDMIAPDAILCRSNGGAMEEVIEQLEYGRATYLQGGGDAIRSMAEAAIELQSGMGTNNPQLCAFTTWSEVRDYVEFDPSGSDLRAFVRLVGTHGAETVIEACDKLIAPSPGGQPGAAGATQIPVGAVVVSTMHRSKGLEWPKVRIGRDVPGPRIDPETWTIRDPEPAEMMLNYVASTRARHELDPGPLREWCELETVGHG